MANPIAGAQIYGNFAGLQSLKVAAGKDDPKAVRQVARQFESLFARMLLKSMRAAIGRDPIFGSDQVDTYQQMYDDQLSVALTQGHGLGLADMLVRELQQRHPASAQGSGSGKEGFSIAPSAGAEQGMPIAQAHRFAIAGARGAAGAQENGAPVSAADRKRFIHALLPQARAAAQALGVAPQSLLAQAALETHWGRSVPQAGSGNSTNNFFGMKAGAGWSGPSAQASTQEFSGGTAHAATAQFRAYASPEQCFQDYVALLRGDPRYAGALGTGGNVQAFASALQSGGYATDPEYASKLCAVAADVTGLLSGTGTAQSLKSTGAQPLTGSASSLP